MVVSLNDVLKLHKFLETSKKIFTHGLDKCDFLGFVQISGKANVIPYILKESFPNSNSNKTTATLAAINNQSESNSRSSIASPLSNLSLKKENKNNHFTIISDLNHGLKELRNDDLNCFLNEDDDLNTIRIDSSSETIFNENSLDSHQFDYNLNHNSLDNHIDSNLINESIHELDDNLNSDLNQSSFDFNYHFKCESNYKQQHSIVKKKYIPYSLVEDILYANKPEEIELNEWDCSYLKMICIYAGYKNLVEFLTNLSKSLANVNNNNSCTTTTSELNNLRLICLNDLRHDAHFNPISIKDYELNSCFKLLSSNQFLNSNATPTNQQQHDAPSLNYLSTTSNLNQQKKSLNYAQQNFINNNNSQHQQHSGNNAISSSLHNHHTHHQIKKSTSHLTKERNSSLNSLDKLFNNINNNITPHPTNSSLNSSNNYSSNNNNNVNTNNNSLTTNQTNLVMHHLASCSNDNLNNLYQTNSSSNYHHQNGRPFVNTNHHSHSDNRLSHLNSSQIAHQNKAAVATNYTNNNLNSATSNNYISSSSSKNNNFNSINCLSIGLQPSPTANQISLSPTNQVAVVNNKKFYGSILNEITKCFPSPNGTASTLNATTNSNCNNNLLANNNCSSSSNQCNSTSPNPLDLILSDLDILTTPISNLTNCLNTNLTATNLVNNNVSTNLAASSNNLPMINLAGLQQTAFAFNQTEDDNQFKISNITIDNSILHQINLKPYSSLSQALLLSELDQKLFNCKGICFLKRVLENNLNIKLYDFTGYVAL